MTSSSQIKTILILLSTYNGDRFLKEQLISLQDQKNVEVCCIARDDGSEDQSINILKEFSKKWNNLIVIEGENIGCANSYLELLKVAVNYNMPVDYFAFCDQDDVWIETKLNTAVSILETMPAHKPILYCSNLTLVDENLNVISNMYKKDIGKLTKGSALVERFGTGCTMVFNKKMVEKFVSYKPTYPILHDRWAFLIGIFFGHVYYDNNPTILYRQHSRNIVGAQSGLVDKWKSRLASFKRLKEKPREQNAKELLRVFDKLLSEEDIQLIKIVADYRKNIFTRFRFFFAHPRYNLRMRSIERNFWLRIRILFGSV